MANPEHLAKLKEGVEAWNKWRKDNPKIKRDLTEANLTEANLTEADLRRADLGLLRQKKRAADWAVSGCKFRRIVHRIH